MMEEIRKKPTSDLMKNNEFDHIFVSKGQATILQCEVKSTGMNSKEHLRKMYDSGLKQLHKGEAFFEKVLAPLSGIQPKNWKYKGMVFFPNIDDRDFFMSLKDDPFTEEEIKKIVTRK